jgi:glycosyltransferase involved in cell wall biosynthesis
MFSVLIPLYNKERSIKNTIQSVLDQNFNDFEIIVVNDGSTDNSPEIVKQFVDPRIRLIHQENQGVSAARNRGIKEAKYEWIAFLDGDDLWEINHLEEILRMMKIYPGEKVYVTSFRFSDGRNIYKHPRSSTIFKIENYFEEAIKEHLISTDNIVVHKECFSKVGGFNVALNRGEDLDLWARLAREYNIIKSKEITAIYRMEAENRSDRSYNLHKSILFSYDFLSAASEDETKYYKNLVIKRLRDFLAKGEFKNFFKLRKKHAKHIPLMSVFKSRKC